MKLATIEKILELNPIPGKDADMATVLGWEILVKRGDFSVGDYCVYIPIDTECDTNREHFSFLRKGRIVTAKFNTENGFVYSQGLCLPFSSLMYIEEFFNLVNKIPGKFEKRIIDNVTYDKFIDFNKISFEDVDVSDIIGVTKYEYKSQNQQTNKKKSSSKSKKNNTTLHEFPISFISKTDEDNLKTKCSSQSELIAVEFYISLKMDGSSMTLIWDDDIFSCSSRNFSLYKGETSLNEEKPISIVDLEYDHGGVMVDFVKKEKLETRMRGKKYAVQGEFVGWKINGNKLKYTEDNYDYFVFTVKNLETGKILGLIELAKFCSENGFKMVPILSIQNYKSDKTKIEFVKYYDFFKPNPLTEFSLFKIKEFQDYANEVKYICANGEVVNAEGIVVRPTIPFYSKILHKSFSVKIINQEYNF